MFSFIYTHAWDFHDEGLHDVCRRVSDWGIEAVNLASSYHAGYFIHSHNPNHKMYMAEDGVVYFRPNKKYFEETPLKPNLAAIAQDTDWLDAVGQVADSYEIKLMSWTVCNHNTPLGLVHPEHTITNIFGDSYPHALCPSSPGTRGYVRGLCRNLAAEYPMYAISLEAPDFSGIPHGHHHERFGTFLRPLEELLMSLCFCKWCLKRAGETGIELQSIGVLVRAHLVSYFEEAPIPPRGRPANLGEMLDAIPELAEMMRFREKVEASLIAEIRHDLALLGETLLVAHDGYRADYHASVDGFIVDCYGKDPGDVFQTLVKERLAPGNHQLWAGLRTGFNEILGPGELEDLVTAASKGGADGVGFYNYSETPLRALEWIRPALIRQSG